jgi:hypothetical protein
MAIQINLAQSQYGIPFAGAYFRISTVALTRQRLNSISKFIVMIDIAGYGTATPGDDTREVDFRRYHAPLAEIEAQSGVTFLEKCYAWVMSQPDMLDSQAV